MTSDLDRDRPEIDFPKGDPTADLQIVDEVEGHGPRAEAGHTVTAHDVGVFSSGEEFDASWNRGRPLDFRLGIGQVIPGWDQGIVGMRVGGRRRLVVPPHLAYGARGAGSVIGPDETLIFVVDLVAVS